jgi:hypothetical protein
MEPCVCNAAEIMRVAIGGLAVLGTLGIFGYLIYLMLAKD